MAEEEEHPATTTPEDTRPQTARKDLRKVPGSFGFDDVDDLSPDKETFDDSIFANAAAHQENNRVPSLDPTTLPSLPPPTDSSLLYNQSGSGSRSDAHPDTLDEKELHRHLNDVESSFVAAPETIGFQDSKGWDDTYLFDGARIPVPPKSPLRGSTPARITSPNGITPSSPPTPANAYKTPGVASRDSNPQESTMDVGNTTSSLETMSSSPTAAAAARTVSRAISMASAGGQDEAGDASDVSLHELSDNEGDTQTTPKKSKDDSLLDSTDSRPSLRERLSSQSLNRFISDAGSTPGDALLNRKQSGKRPKFLRSRHASQRSSVSSIATNQESQDGSEVTLGADYALQSGGAVPAAGFSRSTSIALSRSISLGSMASGIEDHSGSADSSGRALDASLATLTEEEQNRDRKSGEDVSPPETPRATSTTRSMAAPTDTIIARHVRNVQVPESLAQEYRSKSGVSSPNKRSGFGVSTLGRNGKNLTLKEQSSTIERLSKENFDLKLKVMFLSDRLDKLSEEGVKEMISENVELKTGLAIMQRDNKALKRKVKELEKQLKDDEERPSTAVSGTSAGDQPSPQWFDQEGAQEREEELLYLRERVEEYVTEIEKLRREGLARENEKRNLAEVVRNMGERRGQNLEAREEMDVWKDLLEQETSRREQADEDNKKLREEIFRLKSETSSASGVPGLNHTTNIYNITKKRAGSPSRPRSELSDRMEDRTLSAASTLVEELRKDCDQLRHENAELRREVGAQTSMLTSRNREKERLYQEIEDLKLAHRRGGSVAGDSIFERSASRTHERSASRASIATRQTNLDDSEREDLENKNAELRDRINSLKIHNQDLQHELESCMEDFEMAVEQKKQAEDLANELQEALEVAENDLLTIQAERDEALQGQDEAEHLFESLRREAQEELDSYAAETDAAQAEIERLQNDLADSTENFTALQNEMREMSESVVRLEDSDENKSRRIDDLERDLEDANRELEQLEKNLQESNDKINHLTVQRESSQSEIAFLREEQDGDKIKIGDLEAGVRKLEQNLREEKERVAELEQRIKNERHQREIIAGKKQSEVEKQFDRLNRENASLRDDAQRLRVKLNAAAGDAAANAQKVLELENGLKQALGDLHGTKSSLVGVCYPSTSFLFMLIPLIVS
jgi:predicted  nucleic acid-binding Zn-ribbon protein